MGTEVTIHGAEKLEPRTRVAVHAAPGANRNKTQITGVEGSTIAYNDQLKTRLTIHEPQLVDPLKTRVEIEQRHGETAHVALLEAPPAGANLTAEQVLQKLNADRQLARGRLKEAQAEIRDIDEAIREVESSMPDHPRAGRGTEAQVIEAQAIEPAAPPRRPVDPVRSGQPLAAPLAVEPDIDAEFESSAAAEDDESSSGARGNGQAAEQPTSAQLGDTWPPGRRAEPPSEDEEEGLDEPAKRGDVVERID